MERSLVASSSGEGASNKEVSGSAEGTKDDSSSRSLALPHVRGPKVLVK